MTDDKQPFACCAPGGSLRPLVINGVVWTRKQRYCPQCTLTYDRAPCPFRPASPKPIVQQTKRGAKSTNNIFGNGMSDDELIEDLASQWRELGHPPLTREVRHYQVLLRWFGWKSAKELAFRLFSPEEQARLGVYTCERCGRTFADVRGWRNHQNAGCGK